MESQLKSFFWKLVCTLGAWMLVLAAAQGIGLYYLVTRYSGNKHIAQTKLINTQTEKLVKEMQNSPLPDQLRTIENNIDKLEKEILKLSEKSDETLKKIAAADTDTNKDTKGIDAVPDLKIKSQKPYYTSANTIKYIYAIENKGKYPVKISNPKLQLSTSKIYIPEKVNNPLVPSQDYAIKAQMNFGDVNPGEEIKHHYTIEFLQPKKISETFYYSVTFDAQTDINTLNLPKNVDKGKINNKKSFYTLGEIITPG